MKRFVNRTTMVVTPEIYVSGEIYRPSDPAEMCKICVGNFVDRKGVKVDIMEEYPLYIVTEKLEKVKIKGKEIKDYSSLPFTIVDLSSKKLIGKKLERTIYFSSPKWDEKIQHIIKKYDLKNVYSSIQYYPIKGFNGKVLLSSNIKCAVAYLNIDNYPSFEDYRNEVSRVVKDIENSGFMDEWGAYTFSWYLLKDEEFEIDYNRGWLTHKKAKEGTSIPKKWFDDKTIEKWKRYRNSKGFDYEWEILIGTSAFEHIKAKIKEYEDKLEQLKKPPQIKEELHYIDGYTELGYGSGVEIEGKRIDTETIKIRWADIIYGDCGGSVEYSSGRYQNGSEVNFKEEDWIVVKAPYPVKIIKSSSLFKDVAYYQDNVCMVVNANSYYSLTTQKEIEKLSFRLEKLTNTLDKK